MSKSYVPLNNRPNLKSVFIRTKYQNNSLKGYFSFSFLSNALHRKKYLLLLKLTKILFYFSFLDFTIKQLKFGRHKIAPRLDFQNNVREKTNKIKRFIVTLLFKKKNH